MTDRRRNLAILGLVLLLLVGSGIVIATKSTKLGLDLRGGIELVYQGKPTPKVPKVTAQAINDALETIRKRTDALGVSEPEIQRAGEDQISIGLPDVKNAQRAVEQVGTTAQLQFYDWEPNLLPQSRGGQPYTGTTALYDAVTVASKQKPKAEASDVPPEGAQGHSRAYWDKKNDTAGAKFYLFGPDKKAAQGPDESCQELLSDYNAQPGSAPHKYAKGSACESELKALGAGGPRDGSKVIEVPQGIVVVEDEPVPNQPKSIQRLYVLEDDSELSGDQVKNPEQNFDNNQQPIVTMDFTNTGREAFARVTKRIADRGSKVILPPGSAKDAGFQHFAITLDDQIVSLATIDFREFPEGLDGKGGVSIEGVGDVNQAQQLAENLRIGALPIKLDLISQTQVSATLGQQALHQGLIAGLVGLGLTILFLLLFYRVLGAVATLALLIYAVILFALVKLIPITLTLPGIAGLVLTLAVAADANIVMYERIKEEVRSGRSIPAGIAAGYSKALRTIIDANVVTIGVAFILFVIATAGVKGFAFTLGVGTLVSLFTAVLATSAILGSMARTRLLARPSALGVGKERKGWTFDFMGKSRWFFSFSGVILVIGALAIAGKGLNFGIDFESGTRITAPLQQNASVQQVRDVLSPLGYGDAKIQQVDDPALGKHVVQIATGTLQPPQVTKVQNALNDKFGVNTGDFSTSSIGPTFGETVAKTAAIAIVASLLLISIYIALRFEFKFAVPVLIALAHDLLITSGVYALLGREVTTSTVAALLTILGYSLYDTVIVFDRIRENVPRMPRATFSQIANRAMSEVLTRSLATSFAVLMPVGALFAFGGATLKDFAFALFVGVASGAYSSIFIATPTLVEWKEREHVYMRRRRNVMQENDGVVPAFATAAPRGGRLATQPGEGDGNGDAERQRERVAASRAKRRAAAPRAAATPPPAPSPSLSPPTPPPTPPAPAPQSESPPRAPRSTSTTSSTGRATRTVAKDGESGNGADGAPKPPPKPKPKQPRTRGRKKHGRR